ncbi:MAG: hypothetical protein K6E21_05945 [Bacilli bacterium]|nr:hypothetical protein [Bacilli bacterium]
MIRHGKKRVAITVSKEECRKIEILRKVISEEKGLELTKSEALCIAADEYIRKPEITPSLPGINKEGGDFDYVPIVNKLSQDSEESKLSLTRNQYREKTIDDKNSPPSDISYDDLMKMFNYLVYELPANQVMTYSDIARHVQVNPKTCRTWRSEDPSIRIRPKQCYVDALRELCLQKGMKFKKSERK